MLKGSRLIALSACAAGLYLAGASAWAGEIRSVAVQAGSTGTRAEIQLAGGGSYKTLSLAGPNRLVVDFPDSTAVRGLKLPAAAGVVTAVRTGTPAPGTFRVVFDLAESVVAFKPQLQGQGAESRLLIEWPGETSGTSTRPVAANASAPPLPAQPGSVEARREAARATAALTAAVVQQASAAPAPRHALRLDEGPTPQPGIYPPPSPRPAGRAAAGGPCQRPRAG